MSELLILQPHDSVYAQQVSFSKWSEDKISRMACEMLGVVAIEEYPIQTEEDGVVVKLYTKIQDGCDDDYNEWIAKLFQQRCNTLVALKGDCVIHLKELEA